MKYGITNKENTERLGGVGVTKLYKVQIRKYRKIVSAENCSQIGINSA